MDMSPSPLDRLGSEKNKLSNVQKMAARTLRPTQVLLSPDRVSRSMPCKPSLISMTTILPLALPTGGSMVDFAALTWQ
jgi:hypothetical protein